MAQSRRADSNEPPADAGSTAPGPRILKKYPNRRLYDTRTSSYITLADVKQMVLGGENFVVRDAKAGEDLTRSILLQIILEEETGGVPMFSTQMLASIIRFYGHAMQGMMGSVLEKNLQAFVDMQQRFAEQSFTPEMWTQFMNGQAPMMQGLNLFTQLQEQMAKQAGALFPGMPGFGSGAPKK